mmetsp:Transcript_25336/g.69671  ORF Transcript_25336/g.69671 Transcript_25336/m.69671 type:complete len:216 (+) Transcript_25336:896-1543(+)
MLWRRPLADVAEALRRGSSFHATPCWAWCACWLARRTSSCSSWFFLVRSDICLCNRSTVRCHRFSFSLISSSSCSVRSWSLRRSSNISRSSANCCRCRSAPWPMRRFSFLKAARSASNSACRARRSDSTSRHNFCRSRDRSRSDCSACACSFLRSSRSRSQDFICCSKAINRCLVSCSTFATPKPCEAASPACKESRALSAEPSAAGAVEPYIAA